ncbi:MAG TPA: hypothetical protein VFK33_15525 [Bacillales bacterium]|nr:hypothetical protein [Bacillales bacterium]
MPRFLNHRKLWLAVFPILTFLISVALLMVYNLHQELLLPSKNWSRSIKMPLTTSDFYTPFVQKENGHYHIYTYQKGKIGDLVLDSKLQVVKKSKVPLHVKKETPYWIKGNNSLVMQNGKLILRRGERKKVLSRNMDGMAAAASQVIVWRDQKLYTVDLKTFSLTPVATLKNKIRSVVNGRHSSRFLAVSKLDQKHIQLTLFQQKNPGAVFEKIPVITLEEGTSDANQTISGIQFAVSGKQMALVYTVFGITQGGTIRTNHFAAENLKDLPFQSALPSFQFIEKKTHRFLHDPIHIRVAFQGSHPVLLLAASGHMPVGEEAVNIYEAAKGAKYWQAKLVSKTDTVSKVPFWLNDQTVLWLDFIDYDQYQLMGASQNPQVIARSLQLRGEDWMNAFADTLVSLFSTLLIVFYSFLWIAPTGFFMGILAMANMTMMERNPAWIKYTAVGLYVLMQLIFMPILFDGAFQVKAPVYLTFPGSPYVVTLLLAVQAWGMMKVVKGEEWENFAQISFFLTMDVWMVAFLVGPYII